MATKIKTKATSAVTPKDMARIDAYSKPLMSKAMQLTDAWGAMFVMEEEYLRAIALALGFEDEVVSTLYEKARGLKYVVEKGTSITPDRAVFTWHGPDATFLVLRGFNDPGSAFASINDSNLEKILVEHVGLFTKIMQTLPPYTRFHMFSPEVARNVIGSFGANLTPDLLFSLAQKLGGNVTVDLEGRRGISAQFIRSVTLTLCAAI